MWTRAGFSQNRNWWKRQNDTRGGSRGALVTSLTLPQFMANTPWLALLILSTTILDVCGDEVEQVRLHACTMLPASTLIVGCVMTARGGVPIGGADAALVEC